MTGAGGLAGTMTLTKTGTGTLTLSESNTFTGLTTVNGGTLQFKGSSAWPSGSALSLGSATVVIDNDGSGSNGTIALGNNITLDASATATISVANNGSSNTGNKVAFGALKNGTTAQGFNSTFNFVGANGYSESFTSLGLTGASGYATTLNPTSSPVTIAGNVINQETSFTGHYDTLVLSGTVAGNSITGTIADSSGYTSVGNGDTRLTANGTGAWTLSGPSTYHGPTAISGGTLNLTGSWANTQSVTTSGSGVLNESAAGVIGGTATFTQGSSGTTTLAGTNTYTGATAINAGALLVSGSLTSSVSVASGAALGGAGSITGNVTVASGGKLLYSLASGSITGPVIHGNLTLNGTINVTPPATGSLNPGTYTLASYTGAFSGTPTFVWTPPAGNTDTATFNTSTPGVVQIVVSSTSAPISSGLALWFKADSLPANSTAVGNWTDSSGSGTVVSQTGSAMPTYISSDVNGEPAVRFNGSQYLANTSYSNSSLSSGITMISVAMTTNPGALQNTVALGNGAGSQSRNQGYYQSSELLDIAANHASGGAPRGPGQFVSETVTLDSTLTNVVFYQNGFQTAAPTIGGVGAVSSQLFLGNRGGDLAAPWQGDIAEVLVYNRVLTATELNQVDGYLANKYGYYSVNATWPNAYSAVVQAEISRNQWNKAQAAAYVSLQAANPTVLTNGLAAWFKADLGVIQSGGVVTGWTDQTGNNSTTQTAPANQPTYVASDINGKPAVHFNGSQWLYSPQNVGPGLNADMTMIVVGSTYNPSAFQYNLFLGNGAANVNRGMGYISNQQLLDMSHGGWTAGSVPNANTFVVDAESLNSSLTNVTFYRNGTQTGSVGTGGMGALSSGLTIGETTDQYDPWQGDIAEVLVYDHQLSTAEMQQVGVYLANKYGLYNPNATWPSTYTAAVQAEITRNQWSKAQADAYVALQSANPTILTNGLKAWFKADALPTNSTSISSWADQTGNYTVTQSTAATQPTYVASDLNGKPAVHFNGSQALYNAGSMGAGVNGDMTMIAVGATSNPGAQQYTAYLGNTGGYANRGIGYYASRQLFDLSNNNYSLGASTPYANTFVTEAWTLASNLSSVAFYRNGIQTGTATMGSVQNVSPGITIGGYNGYGTPWQGDIAEVLIYDHQLSSAELQQVGVYLANKYGLYNPNATWPSTYTAAVQAEITRNQWNKSQADAYVAFLATNPVVPPTGLTLWLKADTGVQPSGSNVTQWTDQGPTKHVASQGVSANEPLLVTDSLTGKAALSFSGNQSLSCTDVIPASGDLTIISVAEANNTSAYSMAMVLGLNPGGGQARGFGYRSNQPVFDDYQGSVQAGTAPTAKLSSVATVTYTAATNTAAFYSQGSPNGTGTLAVSPLASGFIVGGATWSASAWSGTISEVLVYNRVLTTAEQQAAESYLANKYGLYDPLATWPSTYTAAVQTLITLNQWNQSQAKSYLAFQAANPSLPTAGLSLWLKADSLPNTTTLVSQWPDESPNGNNANGVTGSQPLYESGASTYALNGKPVVHFDGATSFLDVSDASSLRPSTGVSVIAVMRPNTSSPPGSGGYGDVVAKTLNYQNVFNQWTAPLFSYDLGLGNNNVSYGYVGTGSGTGNTLAGAAVQDAKAQITSLVYDSSNTTTPNAVIKTNGTAQLTTTLSGSLFYNAGAQNDLCIGAAKPFGTATRYFSGDVAEVLVYNQALTAAQQAQVEGYLADKYGIYDPNATWYNSAPYLAVKALIISNQWTENQANAYLAFVASNPPVPTAGLSLWLKADSLPSTTTLVSQWLDQSPNGNNANGITGSQPVYESGTSTHALGGNPVVHFDGATSFLDVSDASSLRPSTAVSVFAVMTPNTSSPPGGYSDVVSKTLNYQNVFNQWTDPLFSYDLGLGNNNVSYGYVSTGSSTGNTLAGATVQDAKAQITSLVYDSSNTTTPNAVIKTNGAAQLTTTLSGSLFYNGSAQNDLCIGAAKPFASATRFFSGDVAEVLVYNQALTTAQQAQVELYLANKYGIFYPNTTWQNTYTAAVQAEITRNQWNKTQADAYVAFQAANPTMLTNGLVLWLQANGMQANGTASVTQDGSGNVTAWTDQTGMYTLQGTSGNEPTYVASSTVNGAPGLHFNGGQWLASSASLGPGVNGDMTMITVGTAFSNTGNYALYLGANTAPDVNRAYTYSSGSEYFDGQYVGCAGAAAAGVNIPTIEAASINTALTQVKFYQNGANTLNSNVTATSGYGTGVFQNVSRGLTVGAASGGFAGWQGDIVEQLVYDHQLSPAEITQVSEYLAGKYGISLNVAPTITPAGGSYTSTQSVTLASPFNDSSHSIHYTLDGTIPTLTSPTYTTAVSVASSALVQAVVYPNTGGAPLTPIGSAQFYINDPLSTGLPPVPTGLNARASSGSEIDLTWSLGAAGTYSQIDVYRSTNGGPYALIAVLGPTATTFSDTTVASGSSYTYEVGTGNQAGVAASSGSSAVVPPGVNPLTFQLTAPAGATPQP